MLSGYITSHLKIKQHIVPQMTFPKLHFSTHVIATNHTTNTDLYALEHIEWWYSKEVKFQADSLFKARVDRQVNSGKGDASENCFAFAISKVFLLKNQVCIYKPLFSHILLRIQQHHHEDNNLVA